MRHPASFKTRTTRAPAHDALRRPAHAMSTDLGDLRGQVFRFEIENGLHQANELDKLAKGTCYDPCEEFFSSRGCTRGERCPWRHAQPPSDPRQNIICKHYLKGLCKKREACDYLHCVDYTRMPLCFFFAKFNTCTNEECQYRHVTDDGTRFECPYYTRGFCPQGPKCHMKHTRKVACPKYLAGFCADGPNCSFGHPSFDKNQDFALKKTGVDRFGFGRSKGPPPRIVYRHNGAIATSAVAAPSQRRRR